MTILRPRILLLSLTLLFATVITAFAIPQDEPQVAKNIPAPAIPSAEVKADNKKETSSTDVGYSPSNLNRVGIQTAQPISLTLADAVRRALENNNDIEVSRDDVRFQETQVRSLLGIYDPVFAVTPTFSRSQTTGSEATNDFRVNSNFSKFLERGGGNYQAFFNNTRTENAFAQAQVSSGSVASVGTAAIYSSNLGFNYTQPLWRNFRIDNTRRQITIARRRLEQTDSDFMLRATDTITQTQRAYWDMVFALRNQQNQVANVNFARENLRQIEAKIEAGAAAPLARAEANY